MTAVDFGEKGLKPIIYNLNIKIQIIKFNLNYFYEICSFVSVFKFM